MSIVRKIADHWFYVFLAIGLFAAWDLSGTAEAIAAPDTLEKVFLFDFGIFVPILYFVYLRKRSTMKAALLRTAALAGSGLAFAAYLMPEDTGIILPAFALLRYFALPLLIIIELGTLIAITKYVYGQEPNEEQLVERGVPPLVAKIMLAEARFWKRVFALISGNKN